MLCRCFCYSLPAVRVPPAFRPCPSLARGLPRIATRASRAHQALASVVDSLEGLRQGSGLGRFDQTFENLELTSVKARARAEAIIARGENYFEEWKEQLSLATNQLAAQANYNRMYDHFTRVRQRSGEV